MSVANNVIGGVHPVLEALGSGVAIEAVYMAVGLKRKTAGRVLEAASGRGVKVVRVPRDELDRMAPGLVHQGVVAVAGLRIYTELDELIARPSNAPRQLVLVLDGVQDPRNLGAIARSALAFGAQGLVIPSRRSAGIGPAAVKASAGALARLPVSKVVNLSRALDYLKEAGYWVYGASADADKPVWDVDPGEKVALVAGGEAEGIRAGVRKHLDGTVSIPLIGNIESLNVSVATAVVLYEWLGRPFPAGG
ncbi:MAG: 23S rRNA (guanosine(2251)-2'-O)-methyltransferase RlmB [Deltaproteobacteria bacterium]|nr:MAG: 23S rRNA (guanosine(2251)-2'-O)-methyltransferase RlmB [Deltaproteobacteria bacterium]